MTEIAARTVCHAEDGKPVHEIALGPLGGLSASVLTWGATLSRMSVPDRNGEFENVVLAFNLKQMGDAEDTESYERILAAERGVLTGHRVASEVAAAD